MINICLQFRLVFLNKLIDLLFNQVALWYAIEV